MRLRHMLHLTRLYAPVVASFRADNINLPNGEAGTQIQNRSALLGALSRLRELPAVRAEVDFLLTQPIVTTMTEQGDIIYGTRSAMQIVVSRFQALRDKLVVLEIVLQDSVTDDLPETISIKLPPTVVDIDTLSAFLSDIRLVFDVPLKRLDNPVHKFGGFDSGSSFIELYAATTSSLLATWQIIRLIAKYLKRRRKMKESLAIVTSLQLEPKVAEALQEKDNEAERTLIQQDVKELILPEGKREDPEAVNLMYASVSRGIRLAEDGTQFLPSPKAPPEIIPQEEAREVVAAYQAPLIESEDVQRFEVEAKRLKGGGSE